MRDEKKRRPENRGADGEMVIEVAGGGAKVGPRLVIFVEARPAETFVGVLIIPGEIETMLDQRRAGKSIIADAIAAHPRVQKRKREKPKKEKQPLRPARAVRGRYAEVRLIRQRGTRRNAFLSPAAIVKRQQHDGESIFRDRGRDLVTANNRGGIVPHDFNAELDIDELKRVASIRAGISDAFFRSPLDTSGLALVRQPHTLKQVRETRVGTYGVKLRVHENKWQKRTRLNSLLKRGDGSIAVAQRGINNREPVLVTAKRPILLEAPQSCFGLAPPAHTGVDSCQRAQVLRRGRLQLFGISRHKQALDRNSPVVHRLPRCG
jgi:hypothetical protein